MNEFRTEKNIRAIYKSTVFNQVCPDWSDMQ